MHNELRKQFMNADKDNTGCLSIPQFHDIVRSEFSLSEEIVSTMLTAVDQNNDGKINYLEFLDAMLHQEETEEVYELPEIDDVTAELSKFHATGLPELTEELYELPEIDDVTAEINKITHLLECQGDFAHT